MSTPKNTGRISASYSGSLFGKPLTKLESGKFEDGMTGSTEIKSESNKGRSGSPWLFAPTQTTSSSDQGPSPFRILARQSATAMKMNIPSLS